MILGSTKITLRAPELSDVDYLFNLENDTNYWHLSGTIMPFSRFDIEQYVMTADKDIYKMSQLRFIIENTKEKSLGVVDIFEFNPSHKRAGLGIIINEDDQKNGYAFEALDLVINYCSNYLHLHQLFCNIESDNIASLNLFKKAGFETCGTKKQWNFRNGNWIDEIMLQLIL